MGMLDEADKEQLVKIFTEELGDEVTIVLFGQEESPLGPPSHECQFCTDTREFVEELAQLSDKITVKNYDFYKDADKAADYGIDKIPAMALLGPDEWDPGIRFYGIPAGYEAATLVRDLINLSKRDHGLSQETVEELERLENDVHMQVFVTPTCPYCPRAVLLAHQMAMASPHVRSDGVEVSEFPHLAQRYDVMGVPKTVLNEKVEFVGAMTEKPVLAFVKQAAEEATIG